MCEKCQAHHHPSAQAAMRTNICRPAWIHGTFIRDNTTFKVVEQRQQLQARFGMDSQSIHPKIGTLPGCFSVDREMVLWSCTGRRWCNCEVDDNSLDFVHWSRSPGNLQKLLLLPWNGDWATVFVR
jgi:hypothetical protein